LGVYLGWACVRCNAKDSIMSLCEDGNTGLICVRFGIPVDTRNTNKGRDTGAFYTGVRSNLPGRNKPAKMILSSVVRSEIESVVCSMCILNSEDNINRNSTVTDDEIVIPSTPDS
jgi:hypothetical protein